MTYGFHYFYLSIACSFAHLLTLIKNEKKKKLNYLLNQLKRFKNKTIFIIVLSIIVNLYT
jgi:hypothetical protein